MKRGQGVPYSGYPPSGGSQFFESAIPLILIAILAIFVAAKFGVIDLSGIPGADLIGLSSPKITVGVIGQASQSMKDLLTSEDYRVAGIYYAGDIDQSVVYSGVLNNFNVVILQGSPVCDRTAREVIANFVKAGGKLIVIQDACTRVSDDNSAYGWDIGINSLGDVMPVTIGGVTHELDPWSTVAVQGELKIVAANHPIFNGIKNFAFHSTITTITVPKPNSNILAYVDASSIGQTSAPSLFAIVETSGLLVGKTLYFAYDPSTMADCSGAGNGQCTGRNLFLNALLYLRGASG